jgi:ATP-dependent Clp protease ATP-binding subunit ClpA
MGVTKQAARKRFVPKGPDALDPSQGFERFTVRAKNVVMAAHAEAVAASNDLVIPDHLVLGLLREPDAVAAKVLVECGADLVDVRAAVVLPPAVADPPALVPYDDAAKKVLELTFREALRLGHNYIGTEHLLLALLEEGGDEGVLADLGVDKSDAERHVVAALKKITG